MRLFNCFEGDIATVLSEYDIKTIKACSTKDGIPMMMVNYKDSELCDECPSFWRAIRYWLWHCGVPAKIAFWGVKSDNSDDK